MKTPFDPRHQFRRHLVQNLFAATFNQPPEEDKSQKIMTLKDQIDPVIAGCAPEWPIDKLNRIDLSILRLAVFELMIDRKEPVKVVIDEAIELAKEFGSESSPSFINGVLGAVVKKVAPQEDRTEPNLTATQPVID
jgi:transcription termination factor NusB